MPLGSGKMLGVLGRCPTSAVDLGRGNGSIRPQNAFRNCVGGFSGAVRCSVQPLPAVDDFVSSQGKFGRHR